MTIATNTSVNVKQAVPFFGVTNMEASLRFYIDGIGFKMKNQWIPDREEDNNCRECHRRRDSMTLAMSMTHAVSASWPISRAGNPTR